MTEESIRSGHLTLRYRGLLNMGMELGANGISVEKGNDYRKKRNDEILSLLAEHRSNEDV